MTQQSPSRIPSRRGARAALAALALLALPAWGAAADPGVPPAARELIAQTVKEVLAILNDKALDHAERLQRIEEIAYKRFDFDTMSRLVIAQYWRRFTPAQKKEFIAQFKEFLARTYGDRIDQYTNENVELVGDSPAPHGDVKVLTRIVGGNYEGAEVEYRLRQEKGAWRIIDVKVEGISLVLNYRDQFKSLLSSGGPQGLLDQLRKKNAES